MRRPALALLPAALLAGGLALAQDKPANPPQVAPPQEPQLGPDVTLESIRKEYADFEASSADYRAYMDAINAEVREIIAFQGKVQEARQASNKSPQDEVLKKQADDLENELRARIQKHQEKKPEYVKRNRAYVEGLTAILKKLAALEEKTRDVQVTIYKYRFLADQGAWSDIAPEVLKLQGRHPEDKELQLLAGACNMILPPDQRHPEPTAPCFDKAYALLAPLAKERPEDQALKLLAGVAASALDKNAEAKVLLDGIASLDSIRPAVRVLVWPYDPDGAMKTWRETAGILAEKPEDVDARKKRAELLVRSNAARLAVRDAEIAVKAKPDDASLKLLLARMLYSASSYERAVPFFREAIAAVDTDDSARAELALSLWNSNDAASAKAELAKVKSRDKLPPQIQQGVMNVLGSALEEPWQAELKAREEDKKRDDNPRVLLETERGNVLIELFEDTAPNTVANFVYLAGNKFYDGVKFHRIINGFMAQGGDPTASGTGGPGWLIKDEVEKNPRLHWRGTLSMAKAAAPNTGGSQFFICYVPTPHLNGKHTVFGRVLEGQDVVDALEPRDAIVHATVVRKRAHDYKPETSEQFGHTPWKPGEPREGDVMPSKPTDKKDGH